MHTAIDTGNSATVASGSGITANLSRQVMSSREIAELTGKRHPDVKRDIQAMAKDLKEDVSSFARIYLDGMNRQQTEYLLDREHTDCLLTGYSALMRMAVIKRWRELEEGSARVIATLPDFSNPAAAAPGLSNLSCSKLPARPWPSQHRKSHSSISTLRPLARWAFGKWPSC